MASTILVLNAGSSSLKFARYVAAGGEPCPAERGAIDIAAGMARLRVRDAQGAVLAERDLSRVAGLGLDQAIDLLLAWLREQRLGYDAVGHRVVHGGLHYADPMRVDDEVLAVLQTLVPLAPLHQPYNLGAIRRLAEIDPKLPQVACFDTAFHRSNADLEQRFALPDELHRQGIRRYGFHGLSYAYIASVLSGYDVRAARGKTIVLHLGNGASLCAMAGSVGVASSMGFSALDGIPMATRTGALDPGVVLHLLSARGMDLAAVERLLYRESGLLGVSGISGDMRVLTASTEQRARLAIDLFVYRIVREIGSLTAALGGLDALVFTAGIGEHAANVRAGVLDALGWLGVRIDSSANDKHGPRISSVDSRVSAWVIATDEEVVIARQTLAVLG